MVCCEFCLSLTHTHTHTQAKLTEEQLKFEREFASTEVDVMGEPSLSNSQSFDVYHDSWMAQSRNTSRSVHQKSSSSFVMTQHNNTR